MAEKDFAIVCDASCDLPLSFLEKARVVPVRLADPESGDADPFERVYRGLAEKGYGHVISIHSAASFSPLIECARAAAKTCADAIDVRIVDSGSASAATGMLIDRAARHRSFDVSLDDSVSALEALAGQVRLLVIPVSSTLQAARRRQRGHGRAGLIGRAAATIRMRVTGERGLYLVSGGEITQLARNTDISALSKRLSHAAAAVSSSNGPLLHALVEDGNARALRMVERALEEEGVQTGCLGTVRALPITEEVVGAGSVAVAIAPESSYRRAVPK